MLFNFHVDYQGCQQELAFVQYSFDHHEHQVDIRPHGNSKKRESFNRTKPNTLKLLKESIQAKGTRKALYKVQNLKGGMLSARSACDLSCNRKQVDNLKYAAKTETKSSFQHDVLAHVMQMCKTMKGTDAEFVRSIEAAPEPICILASRQQLVNMERFCTGDSSCVLSVDPTFNSQSLQLHTRICWFRNKNNPVLLGPVLIHQTKTLRPFHYFAATLVR